MIYARFTCGRCGARFATIYEGRCPLCLSTKWAERGSALPVSPFVRYTHGHESPMVRAGGLHSASAEAPVPAVAGNAKGKGRRRRVRSLKERDGILCWLCSKPLGDDVTLDHVIPRSKGGSNALSNLRLAHRSCNGRRGNADPPATG